MKARCRRSCSILLLPFLLLWGVWMASAAGYDPQERFDLVCAATTDAMSMSDDELGTMIRMCDELRPWLEALADPPRRILTRRLEAAKNLYAYVLAARVGEPPQEKEKIP